MDISKCIKEVKEIANDINSLLILGVEFDEDATKNNNNIIKYSVPEKCEVANSIESEFDLSNGDVLMKYAKNQMLFVIKSVVEIFVGNDDIILDDEVLNEIFKNVVFFAKIRKGETWTKEDMERKKKELEELDNEWQIV